MAPIAYKQDMPPPGGYARFVYHRVPAKSLVGTFGALAIYGAMTGVATYLYSLNRRKRTIEDREMTDSKIALGVVFDAERDRALMAYSKDMRAYEADLMKDVPGWEVGTYFGEPVYKTVPRNEWSKPWNWELYSLCSKKDYDYWRGYNYWS